MELHVLNHPLVEHKLMDDEELNKILRPENMVHPRKKITE